MHVTQSQRGGKVMDETPDSISLRLGFPRPSLHPTYNPSAFQDGATCIACQKGFCLLSTVWRGSSVLKHRPCDHLQLPCRPSRRCKGCCSSGVWGLGSG